MEVFVERHGNHVIPYPTEYLIHLSDGLLVLQIKWCIEVGNILDATLDDDEFLCRMQKLSEFDDLIRWSGIEAIETSTSTSTPSTSSGRESSSASTLG